MDSEFSASRVDYFFRCSGAWKLKYIDGVAAESGEPAEVGKMVHEMIKAVLLKKHFDYNGRGDVFAEALDIFGRWQDMFLPNVNPENILAVEQEFKITLKTSNGDIPFHGFMDRVEDVGGFLTITDIKTSRNLLTKEQMRKSWQVRAYCVAALKIYSGFNDVVFRIENPRLKEWQVLEVDREQVNRWEEDLGLACVLIQSRKTAHERGEKGAFPYMPGASCQWCDVFKHCEESKKAAAARKAQVRNAKGADGAIKRIALLERNLKETKDALKKYIEKKGSVTAGGLTWGLWPSVRRKIDEAMIPESEMDRFKVFMVVDDSSGSHLWEDERLVRDLRSWNAIKETLVNKFDAKRVKEGEE